MSQADKALTACREYDRLMTAIVQNTDDIGDGLAHCDRIFTGPDGDYIPDGKNTHLGEAFEPFDDDDGTGNPERGYNGPDEIAEIIGDCEGCAKAYAAIQERKANKKKLGIIKRSIRAIARAKGGAS